MPQRELNISEAEVPAIERVCNDIGKRMMQMGQELKRAKQIIADLLKQVGSPAVCKGCGAQILWLRHVTSGKNSPYNLDGSTHWATCPHAERFKPAGYRQR